LHGSLEGTATALRQFDDCEYVLCAGDVFNQYGGDPRVVDLLRERGVRAVAGNHDVEFVRSAPRAARWAAARAYLAGLPTQRSVQTDGPTIHLVHGAPWDRGPDWSTYLFPHMLGDPRLAGLEGVLVVGHTHLPYVHLGHAGLLVINPGSCGVIDAHCQLHAAILDTRTLDVKLLQLETPNTRPTTKPAVAAPKPISSI
jgi:predicted phosphodiesterase